MNAERRYLAERALLARAGMRAEADRLAHELLEPLQIRALVRRHPRLGVGGAALLGLLLGRQLTGPRSKAAPGPTSSRMASAIGSQLRSLFGSTLGALWLSGLRTPPASPPTTNDGTATDTAVRSEHQG